MERKEALKGKRLGKGGIVLLLCASWVWWRWSDLLVYSSFFFLTRSPLSFAAASCVACCCFSRFIRHAFLLWSFIQWFKGPFFLFQRKRGGKKRGKKDTCAAFCSASKQLFSAYFSKCYSCFPFFFFFLFLRVWMSPFTLANYGELAAESVAHSSFYF